MTLCMERDHHRGPSSRDSQRASIAPVGSLLAGLDLGGALLVPGDPRRDRGTLQDRWRLVLGRLLFDLHCLRTRDGRAQAEGQSTLTARGRARSTYIFQSDRLELCGDVVRSLLASSHVKLVSQRCHLVLDPAAPTLCRIRACRYLWVQFLFVAWKNLRPAGSVPSLLPFVASKFSAKFCGCNTSHNFAWLFCLLN